MGNIVFLTESAKEQMDNMLSEHNKSAVRLALKGGGCAGFKYDWTLEDSVQKDDEVINLSEGKFIICLLYTSPSPRDLSTSRMPSSA